MGVLGLLTFACLVVATAWAIVRAHAQGALDLLLGVAVWSAAVAVACVLALSPFRALGAPALLGAAAAAAGIAWGVRWRHPPAPPTWPRASRALLGPLLVALPIAAFAAVSLHTAWRAPEIGNDNLAYHLPRLGYWMQQRAVAPFVAGNMRAGSMPPVGDVLALVPALFLGHDRACALVQLAAALLTAAAIAATARRLGATHLAAALAGLCWFVIPSVLDQALWTLVDLVVAFFVAVAAAFVARRDASAGDLATALVAAVLATFTKTHAAAFTAPLALCALSRLARSHPRVRGRVALLALPVVLFLGGFYHLQNLWTWGDAAGLASNRSLVVHPAFASFCKNLELAARPLTRLLVEDAGPVKRVWLAASQPGLGLFWLAPALVTAAALVRAAFGPPEERRTLRPWLAQAALAIAGGAVVCAVLRHQPSQARYLLPAAALFTVAFAWTFDRLVRPSRLRAAVAVLACAGASLVMRHWVLFERTMRTGPRYLDLQPLAEAVSRLAPGARIGLMTSAYFPESLFFGDGYPYQVLPLSYAPPRSPEALEDLRLDALWLETSGGCGTAIFRRERAAPAAVADRSWRAATDYDADFTRAYDASLVWLDGRPTLVAAASSSWVVGLRHPRGVWLVRGEGGAPVEVSSLCPSG